MPLIFDILYRTNCLCEKPTMFNTIFNTFTQVPHIILHFYFVHETLGQSLIQFLDEYLLNFLDFLPKFYVSDDPRVIK